MKKALSILLAVLMFTSLIGVSAFAEGFGGDGSFVEANALLKETEVPSVWTLLMWIKEPTCTENGVGLYDKDGTDPEPEPIAARGHVWGPETIVPDGGADCISGGYFHKEKVCSVCGAVEITVESKYYPPEMHVWGGEKVLKPQTCVAGEAIECCQVCGTVKPGAVPYALDDPMLMQPHQFGDWTVITEPKCFKDGHVEDGFGVHYCNVCRLQEYAPIPAHHGEPQVVKMTRVDCYTCDVTLKCPDCGYTVELTGVNYTDLGMTEQHLFGDWEVTADPLCETDGNEDRECEECGYVESRAIPKLGHKMSTEPRTLNMGDLDGDGLDDFVHYNYCVNDADPTPGKDHVSPCGLAAAPTIIVNADGEFEINPADARFELFDGHAYGEWICLVEPVEGSTYGHWVRVCMIPVVKDSGDEPCAEREEFIGTQAEFDAYNESGEAPVTPVPYEPVNGLVWVIDENGDPICILVKDDAFAEDFTGIYEQDGGKFFVANGIMCSDANGAAEYDGTFYFLANGQIQTQYTGLALYDGEWFYVKEGVIDIETNGLVEHDGSLFLVGAGRIQKEVNGLVVLEDGAYYVANGQVVTTYTGLVQYDGAFFYVENGKLNLEYNGTVEYDGEQFDVQNGQVA